jgi:hypothetical protein
MTFIPIAAGYRILFIPFGSYINDVLSYVVYFFSAIGVVETFLFYKKSKMNKTS